MLRSGLLIFSFVCALGVVKGECSLPEKLRSEIRSYQGVVDTIIATVTAGPYAGKFYDDLAFFTDTFGSRKLGTVGLENSIKYLAGVLSTQTIVNKLESVEAPNWIRGKESAYYFADAQKTKLRIKALGNSANGTVIGPLLIVRKIEEIDQLREKISGKIVLFNGKYLDYSISKRQRTSGPAKASKYGALGALVRSVTPFSIGNIHVGVTDFEGEVPIPAAAISLEDADKLERISKHQNVQIQLTTEVKKGPLMTVSQNLIADIPGISRPNSYVTLSGHIDSWDVGQGVLDDGGGAFLALHALRVMKFLALPPPQRTIRAILWTAEEMGLYGATKYAAAHPDELLNWVAAFESDEGLYELLGLRTNADDYFSCILQEILSLYSKLDVTKLERTIGSVSSDISVFTPFGIPLIEPLMKPNDYFWFHHTEGDSMRTMNSTIMDRHLAVVTGMAYILANIKETLPRDSLLKH